MMKEGALFYRTVCAAFSASQRELANVAVLRNAELRRDAAPRSVAARRDMGRRDADPRSAVDRESTTVAVTVVVGLHADVGRRREEVVVATRTLALWLSIPSSPDNNWPMFPLREAVPLLSK